MQRTYHLNLEERANVPRAGMETLMRLGTRRKYADGQTIFETGDKGDGFFVVIDGRVKIGRYGLNGHHVIFGVFGPGDILGQLAYFAGVPRQTHGIADGDVDILWVDAEQCKEALATDVDLAMLLLRSLATQLMTTVNRIDEQSEPLAPIRLAKALFNMAAAGNVIQASQQELADYIGVSRVTLSAALRKLRSEGLVTTRYGTVVIKDIPTMAKWIEQVGIPEK